MMSSKFLCLALTTKDTYWIMALIVWLIFTKINEVNKIGQSR